MLKKTLAVFLALILVAVAAPLSVFAASVSFEKTSDMKATVGKTYKRVAIVEPAGAEVTYSSSDKSVATVDGNGRVKAIAEGKATITAKSGGEKASYTVVVSGAAGSAEDDKQDESSTKSKAYVGKDGYIVFPDPNLLKMADMYTHPKGNSYTPIPMKKVNKITPAQAANVFSIFFEAGMPNSLDGIEYFTTLELLEIVNSNVTSFTLPKMESLKQFTIARCPQLTKINISKNPQLAIFHVGFCEKLDNLDISKNTNLQRLGIPNTNISSIDISKHTNLYALNILGTKIKSLDITHNSKLREVNNDGNVKFIGRKPKRQTDWTHIGAGYTTYF